MVYRMLGISRSAEHSWRSKPVTSDIPISLYPTNLQQMRVHRTWIDPFPFPQMCKNIISLGGVFNEKESNEDPLKQPRLTLKLGGLSLVVGSYRIENGKGICEEIGISILVA